MIRTIRHTGLLPTLLFAALLALGVLVAGAALSLALQAAAPASALAAPGGG